MKKQHMLRKRKFPVSTPLNVQLTPDPDFLASHSLPPRPTQEDSKGFLKDQINENKKFLKSLTRFSTPDKQLPATITQRNVQETLKALNSRIGSIAFSKEILEDYEKHFQAMRGFFQKVMVLAELLPSEEIVIWRMFFLNNMAMVAFNNGDYSTSFELLKEVLQAHKTKDVIHPVFTIAITNLSAIYHKMNSKAKCYEYLDMSFEYSKKLVDQNEDKTQKDVCKGELSSILAIQCIMVMKSKQNGDSNHNCKEIETLMVKLIKEVKQASSEQLDIPFVNEYLEEKHIKELVEVQSTKTSKKKEYFLKSINNETTSEMEQKESQDLDSPAKRYSYFKITKDIELLNQRYLRLEMENSQLQSSLKELIFLVKGKQSNDLQSTNEISLMSNIELTLEKTNMIANCIFKTLQINVEFYDQGIKLKTFTGEEQKLSWGELQNLFKMLRISPSYFYSLQVNPTKHSVAWLISKYIHLKGGIKIKEEPLPILLFSHNGQSCGLFHIKGREFTINGQGLKPIIYEMCEKSFNYYFSVLKMDEYDATCLSFFDEEPQRMTKEYYLEVIQLKDGTNFEEDIEEILTNLKHILKSQQLSLDPPDFLTRVKIWFDTTTDSYSFLGTYFRTNLNSTQSRLQFKMHTLNSYEGLNVTQSSNRNISFGYLSDIYNISNIAQLEQLYLRRIITILVDLTLLKVRLIKTEGKIKHMIHSMVTETECIYMQQRMILKKYYRPLVIYILKSPSKVFSIRVKYFNQAQTEITAFSILLDLQITESQQKNPDLLRKKFTKIKQKLKTEFILKHFIKMEQTVQSTPRNFIHLEEFIGSVEEEQRNERSR